LRELRCGVQLDEGPVLVTGAGGFVGRHLMEALGMGEGDWAVDLTDDFPAPPGVRKAAWPLPGAPPDGIGEVRYVVHLAAISSVSRSLREVRRAYETNLMGTLSVLETVASQSPGARMLLVSSAEVYRSVDRLIAEESEIGPCNPYGTTKAAAEIAAGQFSESFDLDIVVSRSFPHFGPGQDSGFALPSFCRRIIRAAREGGGSMRVGNLRPIRDYLYVGDVVRAYCYILARGRRGGVYNVCGGEGRSMAEILRVLIGISGADVSLEVDPELFRPADMAFQVGDPTKLRALLGWRPRLSLEEGLQRLYEWWEERI
jgi:GDP-4-dehydro-6-deoxy-D-mannose reductase